MEALAVKLSPVEIEKFIMIINREGFDYTRWRKHLWMAGRNVRIAVK
jgi:hypothetical protein